MVVLVQVHLLKVLLVRLVKTLVGSLLVVVVVLVVLEQDQQREHLMVGLVV
jgi:hypothetical protein